MTTAEDANLPEVIIPLIFQPFTASRAQFNDNIDFSAIFGGEKKLREPILKLCQATSQARQRCVCALRDPDRDYANVIKEIEIYLKCLRRVMISYSNAPKKIQMKNRKSIKFDWSPVLEVFGTKGSIKVGKFYTGNTFTFEYAHMVTHLSLAYFGRAANAVAGENYTVQSLQEAGKNSRLAAGVAQFCYTQILLKWQNSHPLLPLECQRGTLQALVALGLAQAQTATLCVALMKNMKPKTLTRLAYGSESVNEKIVEAMKEIPKEKMLCVVPSLLIRTVTGLSLSKALAMRCLAVDVKLQGRHGEAAVAMIDAAKHTQVALKNAKNVIGSDDATNREFMTALDGLHESCMNFAKYWDDENRSIFMMLTEKPQLPPPHVVAKITAFDIIYDKEPLDFTKPSPKPKVKKIKKEKKAKKGKKEKKKVFENDSDFDIPDINPNADFDSVIHKTKILQVSNSGKDLLNAAIATSPVKRNDWEEQQKVEMNQKIQQVSSIAGCDHVQANKLLEENGWNTERAILMHFNQ